MRNGARPECQDPGGRGGERQEEAEGLGEGGLCPAGLVDCFTGFDIYPKSNKLLKDLKRARD